MSDRYDTAGTILNEVAIELGLGAQPSPFASTDEAIIQLRTLLTTAGKELYGIFDWEQLTKHYAFDTAVGKSAYQLPRDFGYMIDQTSWTMGQSTGPIPLFGATSQQWQFQRAYEHLSISLWATFRQERSMIDIWPTPVAPAPPAVFEPVSIDFEYQSNNWAIPSAKWEDMQNSDTEDAANVIWQANSLRTVTTSDDLVLFEPAMISRLLRAKWQQAKGFDSTAAVAELTAMLTNWMNRNQPRKSINLNKWMNNYPYIGEQSIPFTGYGSPADI